jgi:hypothetical protein
MACTEKHQNPAIHQLHYNMKTHEPLVFLFRGIQENTGAISLQNKLRGLMIRHLNDQACFVGFSTMSYEIQRFRIYTELVKKQS